MPSRFYGSIYYFCDTAAATKLCNMMNIEVDRIERIENEKIRQIANETFEELGCHLFRMRYGDMNGYAFGLLALLLLAIIYPFLSLAVIGIAVVISIYNSILPVEKICPLGEQELDHWRGKLGDYLYVLLSLGANALGDGITKFRRQITGQEFLSILARFPHWQVINRHIDIDDGHLYIPDSVNKLVGKNVAARMAMLELLAELSLTGEMLDGGDGREESSMQAANRVDDAGI